MLHAIVALHTYLRRTYNCVCIARRQAVPLQTEAVTKPVAVP
jgi:hypothetical protein